MVIFNINIIKVAVQIQMKCEFNPKALVFSC